MIQSQHYWLVSGNDFRFPSLAAAKNHVRATYKPAEVRQLVPWLEIVHFLGDTPLAFATVRVTALGKIVFSRSIKF